MLKFWTKLSLYMLISVMLIEKKTCILRYVYRPPRNIVHDPKLHTLQRGFTLALLRYLQARIIENTLYFFDTTFKNTLVRRACSLEVAYATGDQRTIIRVGSIPTTVKNSCQKFFLTKVSQFSSETT